MYDGRIVFTDIEAERLCSYYPKSGLFKSIEVGGRIGPLALLATNGVLSDTRLLAGFERTIIAIDPFWGNPTTIRELPFHGKHFRCNEGRVDPEGNFIFSVMDTTQNERDSYFTGAVMRFRPGGELETLISGQAIPNGTVFHDGQMYYIESRTAKITRYKYDATKPLEEPQVIDGICSKWSRPERYGDGAVLGYNESDEPIIFIGMQGAGEIHGYSLRDYRLMYLLDAPGSNSLTCPLITGTGWVYGTSQSEGREDGGPNVGKLFRVQVPGLRRGEQYVFNQVV
jgi:sugar lactone lactonase YvrE